MNEFAAHHAAALGFVPQVETTTENALPESVGNNLKTYGFAPAQRIALLQMAIDAAYHDRNRRDHETVSEYFNAFAKLLKAR